MSVKKKAAIILWNAFVDTIPIILPLVIQHKDKIVKNAKKIKIN
jgi:adenylyl- and sulfurtransferase ThiI